MNPLRCGIVSPGNVYVIVPARLVRILSSALRSVQNGKRYRIADVWRTRFPLSKNKKKENTRCSYNKCSLLKWMYASCISLFFSIFVANRSIIYISDVLKRTPLLPIRDSLFHQISLPMICVCVQQLFNIFENAYNTTNNIIFSQR